MSYCPSCRGEFREGFVRCEKCGEDLVESLDGPPSLDPADEENLVLFRGCANLIEAGGLQALLRANGIEAFVQGENHQRLLGQFGPMLGDVRVFVPRSQLDRANEAVASTTSASALTDEGPTGQDDSQKGTAEEEGDIDQRLEARRQFMKRVVVVCFLGPLGFLALALLGASLRGCLG